MITEIRILILILRLLLGRAQVAELASLEKHDVLLRKGINEPVQFTVTLKTPVSFLEIEIK